MSVDTAIAAASRNVPECVAAAEVDMQTGMLLGIQTEAGDSATDLELVAAATADLFQGISVTDLALGDGRSPRGRWPEEAAWLCRQFDAGATVCSVCTGAVLLAEAGLLDGQEATTHWSAARIFAEHYPKVRLRPERLLCPSGADQRIVTGGGAGSWADLALYLVARFAGPAEAVRIAKVFVLGDRSDGQLVYSAMARPRDHGDAAIGACQRWIAGNYAVPNPVTAMVARSGLSERSFKRRFRAATGYTPIDYVQALRIEEARQILETTGEPVEAVAQAVGYEDPTFFRRLFKRLTGVSPGRYRRHYAAMILPGRIGAGAG